MKIFKVSLLVAFAIQASLAIAKEPLPLSLSIDVSGIDDVNEFSGGEDAVAALVREKVSEYFTRKFKKFWTISDDGARHSLIVEVEIDSSENKPEFTFQLTPDGGPEIFVISNRKVGSPAQSERFRKRMGKAIRKALKGEHNKVYAASSQIQDNWNFGITTKIKINRPLSDKDVAQFRDDQLLISWPHTFTSSPLNSLPPEPFFHDLPLPPSVPRVAHISPSPHTGHLGKTSDHLAKLCIHRNVPTTPQGVQPVVTYNCPIAGQCTLQSASPEGWASEVCERQGLIGPALRELFGTKAANANQTEQDIWYVPDLSTLYKRLKNDTGTFVGFTDFEIETESLQGIDADSYSARVTANGTPIWLDGLNPDENRRHFDAGDGILLRFGLENLQFSGRTNGCEALTVELNFFKDNKKVERQIVLNRRYAAMRHANETIIDTLNGTFTWSGHYNSPAARSETGIFVKSSRIFHKDDKAAAEEARNFLNGLRKEFDSYNWTIRRSQLGGTIGNSPGTSGSDVLKLVGKLRPPTKARDNGGVAYGILVGLEHPNGQLQFSFDKEQYKRLGKIVLDLRRKNPKAKKIIEPKLYAYTYTEKRKNAPNWVCFL